MTIGPLAIDVLKMPRYFRVEIGWRKAWASAFIWAWWR